MQAAHMCFLLHTLAVMMANVPPLVRSCDFGRSVCGAYSPGDIIIAMMFPSHHKVIALDERTQPESYQCSDFYLVSFMRSLATIHAIEEVNAAGVLPGVHLGYIMCDTCCHASKALQNVEHILAANGSLNVQCNYTDFKPQVKIALGARYSEVSIAVAKLLSVYMIPLMSSTSSSPVLSDKQRYPVFLRTIPSDKHQTKALAKLMAHFSWNWVGVVYGDDDYGKAAFQSFVGDAQANGVCLAYQEVLPYYFDHEHSMLHVRQVAEKIRRSTAQVVLVILRAELVDHLFKEMIRTSTSKTWIASDTWSINWSIARMDGINKVGDILGFSFVSGHSESFDNSLKNLGAPPGGYNRFIEEYKNLRFNCTPECFSNKPPSYCPSPDVLKIKSDKACSFIDPQKQNDDYLVKALDTSEAFLERVAVWATATALKNILRCNTSSCSGEKDFPPWKLLEELKKVKFEYDKQSFFFDNSGDFVNGYDLLMWTKDGDHRKIERKGRYHALDEQIELDEKLTWDSATSFTIPESRCSERCRPGWIKKIVNVSCCYSCIQCTEGYYSDDWGGFGGFSIMEALEEALRFPRDSGTSSYETPYTVTTGAYTGFRVSSYEAPYTVTGLVIPLDLHDCKKCPAGTGSLKGMDRCVPLQESYMRWIHAHPITMMAATAFGMLLLFVTFIIFLVHRNSPPMRRAEVTLSCVMMAGLLVSFTSVICFMGKPNIHLCRARQVLYAMGFTLCVSCILVKAYRTFLVFIPFGPLLRRGLYKLYKPAAIVTVLTSLQGLICLFWMIFDSPDTETIHPPQSLKKVLQCSEGQTYIGFGIMLAYVALLALSGFLLAFKGRKVPQEFSETGYIIFSMLMYLFVWVCFVPVYITNKEESTAVQASAILVSNYGVIFCHFLPKCYDALCGSNTDVLDRVWNRLRGTSTPNSEQETNSDVPTRSIVSDNEASSTVVNNIKVRHQVGTSKSAVNHKKMHYSLKSPAPRMSVRSRRRTVSM